ncbi:hypothetical protein G6F40_017979 [Rhizopus arrhizus]|nr:hypothetical protein G6F40_017979 [Rhizopus arrhizus]
MSHVQRHSYYEADARERIAGLVDTGSFREFLGPARRMMSPHLAQLDQPAAFDDGIVVGEATLRGKRVLLAAQQADRPSAPRSGDPPRWGGAAA